MKFLMDMQNKFRPLFGKGGKLEKLHPLFDAGDTFLFTPDTVTDRGAHVRDAVDLKRVMMFVIFGLLPCTLMGIWNAGHQFNAINAGAPQGLFADVLRGCIIVLPIIFVSYAAGGIWEVLFACVRKHEVNEGLLVTGAVPGLEEDWDLRREVRHHRQAEVRALLTLRRDRRRVLAQARRPDQLADGEFESRVVNLKQRELFE